MSQFQRSMTGALGALTLIGGFGALTTTQAVAAGETCQGEDATIVSSDRDIIGTEGDDVIVLVGPERYDVTIDAKGGDDVICLVMPLTRGTVDAGPGNDLVDTTGVTFGGVGHYLATPGSDLIVDLGAGEDRFVGGEASERVTADAEGSAEDDVILTGGGKDRVNSGTSGFLNGDTIDLGQGNSELDLFGTRHVGPPVNVGTESALGLGGSDWTDGSLAIDASAGTIQRDGTDWGRWEGSVRGFNVSAAELVFRGSDRPEWLIPGAPALSVDLGGGDDTLHLGAKSSRTGSVLDGGPGLDRITFSAEESPESSLYLNLATGVLSTEGPSTGSATMTARNFEKPVLRAHHLTALGTGGDDDIIVSGCKVSVQAGPGADKVSVEPDWDLEIEEISEIGFPDCDQLSALVDGGEGDDDIVTQLGRGDIRVRGGAGDDTIRSRGGTRGRVGVRMWGGAGDDVLAGSGGDDSIRGQGGKDRILGSVGNDDLRGGTGSDMIKGGRGQDTIRGQKGHDRIWGHAGKDRLLGGPGKDRAQGGRGHDLCRAVEIKRGCER